MRLFGPRSWSHRLWHRHVMRNLSTGSTFRYCVAGLWDKEQKDFVKCDHTDEKAK